MKYIAKLYQSGSGTPTSEIAENTFTSEISISKSQVGNFILYSDDPIFSGIAKCEITNQVFCNEETGDIMIIRLQKLSDNAIEIRVQDRQTNLFDNALGQWADNIITIEVYP